MPAAEVTLAGARSIGSAIALLALLLLAACATTRPLASATDQQAVLQELTAFSLTGRVGFIGGGQDGAAPLEWKQRGDASSLRLAGGRLAIDWSPQHLRLSSGGETREGSEGEAVLVEQLGFVPPFAALRYWMLGLVAPGEPPVEQSVGDNGRLQLLVQQGWRIRYSEWMHASVSGKRVEVPRRMVATRDDVRLTVRVSRWRL